MFSHVGTTTPESVLSERAEDDPAMAGARFVVSAVSRRRSCARSARAATTDDVSFYSFFKLMDQLGTAARGIFLLASPGGEKSLQPGAFSF